MNEDLWKLGDRTFRSRIIVGTGKYSSLDETRAALAASGAEIVTVALRRVDLSSKAPTVLDAIDRKKYVLLPNTAGCYTADEAIRTLHLARELGMDELVKLEVIGDPKTLFPDNTATVEAAKRLVAEGFKVLPYCSDDLITCKRLEDAGCLAVMPLAAPIGSGLGIRNPHNIRLILENVERAGDRRCRRRHRERCRDRDGARLHRGVDEHRYRGREAPRADGRGDATRRRRRAARRSAPAACRSATTRTRRRRPPA